MPQIVLGWKLRLGYDGGMAIKIVKLKQCVCEECRHRWVVRSDKLPRRCAKKSCQSLEWNGARKLRYGSSIKKDGGADLLNALDEAR